MTVTSFGSVGISGGAKLDVSNPSGLGSGGSVFIRSGMLSIDASEINADNYGAEPGGQVLLRGDQSVLLGGGNFRDANIHADVYGGGQGASVAINSAGDITLNSAFVSSNVSSIGGHIGSGNGGSLTISAGSSVRSLTGGLITTISLNGATGNAGNIVVTANQDVSLGSTDIGADTFSSGNAGNVSVEAGRSVSVGSGGIGAVTLGAGNGGTVSVRAGTSISLDGGTIGSQTLGNANAGGVIVTAPTVSITHFGSISAVAETPMQGGGGAAGTITVNSSDLFIGYGGTISTSAEGHVGVGGDVVVNLAGQLLIDGSTQQPLASPVQTGIFSTASVGSGHGGQITVHAGDIALTDGGAISTSTIGAGSAGSVSVVSSRDLVIRGIRAGQISGISSDADAASAAAHAPPGSGNAGLVSVTAGNLEVSAGAGISAKTVTQGAAGEVVVSAGYIRLSGGRLLPRVRPEPAMAAVCRSPRKGR